jgi:hypothetical protein
MSDGSDAPARNTTPQVPEERTPQFKGPEEPPRISVPLPTELLHALEKVPDENAKAMLSMAVSRTTFGFGPDPETAKILAQTEIHEEECKLKGFQASLQNREEQNKRDHEFRKKKLNHQTGLTVTILTVTIAAIGGGLVLSITGNPALGNPVLIASFTVMTTLAGKLLASRDKD